MRNKPLLAAVFVLPLLTLACDRTENSTPVSPLPDSTVERMPPAAGTPGSPPASDPSIAPPDPQPVMPGPDTIPPSPQAQQQPDSETRRAY